MKIKSIAWRNFGSYGNRLQEIKFDQTTGAFYVITGANGAGKCLDKDTGIEIIFSDKLQQKRFEKFLKERTHLDI